MNGHWVKLIWAFKLSLVVVYLWPLFLYTNVVVNFPHCIILFVSNALKVQGSTLRPVKLNQHLKRVTRFSKFIFTAEILHYKMFDVSPTPVCQPATSGLIKHYAHNWSTTQSNRIISLRVFNLCGEKPNACSDTDNDTDNLLKKKCFTILTMSSSLSTQDGSTLCCSVRCRDREDLSLCLVWHRGHSHSATPLLSLLTVSPDSS